MAEDLEARMDSIQSEIQKSAETLALGLGLDAVHILTVNRQEDGTEMQVAAGYGLLVARVELAREFVMRHDNELVGNIDEGGEEG